MSVPNHEAVIDAVYARGGWDLTTKAGCGKFREACAWALHQIDPLWGDLKKKASQNNYLGRAVDAVLWKGTGQAVDIIVKSESADARPGWQVDIPRYSDADWLMPVAVSEPEPEPEPPPIPKPQPDPKPQPCKPVQDYNTVMGPFGLEIGELLTVPGSPYIGNYAAVAQVAVYLTHKIQFRGWTLDQARADAKARAGN